MSNTAEKIDVDSLLTQWLTLDRETERPYRFFQRIVATKLNAKERVRVAEKAFEYLQTPCEHHSTMVMIFGEFISKNDKLALQYGQFVLTSNSERPWNHLALITRMLKSEKDPRALADQVYAMEKKASPTATFQKQPLRKILLKCYQDAGIEPPERDLFSPFSAEANEALKAFAPLPLIAFKGTKLTFKNPLGSETRDVEPGLKARYVKAWLLQLQKLRVKHPRFEDPVQITVATAGLHLLNKKCFIDIGWLEPYQYQVAIEQKTGALYLIDHETQKAESGYGLDALIKWIEKAE